MRASISPRATELLAELAQVRHGQADFVASPGPATMTSRIPASIDLEGIFEDMVLLDPVCGMTVERAQARHWRNKEPAVYPRQPGIDVDGCLDVAILDRLTGP